jgi:acetyltransferase-like isoleucine patch superfamily enzyme
MTQTPSSKEIKVGKYTYGPFPQIEGHPFIIEGSTIGKYCSIGPKLRFIAQGRHQMDWVSTYPLNYLFNRHDLPVNDFPDPIQPIHIGNDVWTGANVRIKQNVTIGDGAIVAAESYVTGNIPPYAIVGGNPAKIIRYRFTPEQIEALLDIKWWDWDEELIRSSIEIMSQKDMDKFIAYAKSIK